MTSGTNLQIRGTTLITSERRSLSDSNKSQPVTGATGSHYLKIVRRTDSGSRSLDPSAPAYTNRRLSAAFEKSKFSVNVFYMLEFNHKTLILSIKKCMIGQNCDFAQNQGAKL